MTNREIVYACLDEIKVNSDDSFITEEYVLFLCHKWRAMLLKQRYSDIKKEIPTSNYQTICLSLEEANAIDGEPCTGGTYLRSIEEVPTTLTIGNNQVYPTDYYQGEITYVSKEKMKYVGYNKWLKNIIYASLGADNHLYFKSNNPQHKYLESVRFTGIFEDSDKAAELSCDKDEKNCNYLDRNFPIEEALVPELIKVVVQEILGIVYKPKDDTNNANDDLSALAAFLRNNVKSNLQKQIEG